MLLISVIVAVAVAVAFASAVNLLQQANRLADGASTPDELKKQKLGRRLSSFSSLPNITLMRRKTNSMSSSSDRARQIAKETKKRQMSAEGASTSSSAMDQLICNNVDCLVDQGLTGIRRAVINGIDTISLTESLPVQQDSKCTIL